MAKSLKKRLRAISGSSTPRQTKRTAAYERGLSEGQREGRRVGKVEGRQELRDELTFQLGVAEGEILIGAKPEVYFFRAQILPAHLRHPRLVGDYLSMAKAIGIPALKTVTFRAVKTGWSSGNGDRFVWFTWELCR